MPWKKILCCVDFSEASREALRIAATTAAVDGAELIVAHAWAPPVYFIGETVGLPASMITDMVATAERELAVWRTEAIGHGATRVVTALVTGAPWNELVGLAKRDPKIDLIVTGSHGRTGIKHVLIGSVAERVVQLAPCPVLVLRA